MEFVKILLAVVLLCSSFGAFQAALQVEKPNDDGVAVDAKDDQAAGPFGKIVEDIKNELKSNIEDFENVGPFPGGQILFLDAEKGIEIDVSLKYLKPSAAVAEMVVSRVGIHQINSSVEVELVLSHKPLIVSALCEVNKCKTPFGLFEGSGSCSFKIMKLSIIMVANFTTGFRSYPGIEDVQIKYFFEEMKVLHFPQLTMDGKKEIHGKLFSMSAQIVAAFAREDIEKWSKPHVQELLDRSFRYVDGFYEAVSGGARKPDEL